MVCWLWEVLGRRPLPVSYLGGVVCFALAVAAGAAGGEDPRLDYARQLLRSAEVKQRVKQTVGLRVDESLGHPEAFAVEGDGRAATIRGGGPAGVLYGVHEWLASPATAAAGAVQRPDFALRGTVLFLMKEANYDYQLTPEEFPWFYDRALLTRYFDYLLANRFNTIFLWSGHLFPSIVHLPEYPDATDLARDQLLRNQEQFRWFTGECARRNVSVLVHFYQIHIPKPLARARNIPVQYNRPNEFVTRFVRYSLGRFLAEFDSVGLYVCPGEALATPYQPEWIRDVIFAAARTSGRNPVIVVRDWTLDAEHFKEICVGRYENLYTELKHNVEMLVSPVPDERHARWKKVARKHVVNLHEVADVKPFRWGSPRFVREMAGQWKKIGLDGAEVYGMVSWRWPYALDKLHPEQKGFWPPGPKLLTFERDAIWLEAIGRYLWKVDRDPKEEAAYWTARLGEKFGNAQAGRLLAAWYDTTGPILPGLQNLTHVRNMNYFPTAIGREQNVDAILATEACDRDYPARPVDSWFFERYQARYAASGLRGRITLPIAEYAERLARGQKTSDAMTPDRVVGLLAELAEEGLRIARDAERAATANRDEAARFVTDSQALVYITRAWQHKVLAAIAKRVYQRTGDEKEKEALREHLRRSITAYEELVALTDRTYLNATDMLLRLNWHEGLAQFKADRAAQERFLALDKARRDGSVVWLEAEEMEGNWKLKTNYPGYSGMGFRVSDGPEQRGTALRKRLAVGAAGRYAVWTRGLLAGTTDRSFAVEVAGKKSPPTHGEPGPRQGQFVWRKAGEVELSKGPVEIVVRDAGPGYECPDVIVLALDPKWQPPD